uniref:Uncharacterized protein n=1 Tax=Daphnia galeata TaxID=27404 RepID=A0A8J2WCW8_9CRUS|nr:unnamed protein product [Daphnia galeata]
MGEERTFRNGETRNFTQMLIMLKTVSLNHRQSKRSSRWSKQLFQPLTFSNVESSRHPIFFTHLKKIISSPTDAVVSRSVNIPFSDKQIPRDCYLHQWVELCFSQTN